MDFITEEVATELGLTSDTIAKLTPLYEKRIADVKKEFEGKANENAENIILGAITQTAKKFNVELEREQGEKNADYLTRLNTKVVETQQSNVTKLEAEYKQKLKDVGNGDATAKELEAVKGELDTAKKTLADFDSIKERADKYDATVEQLSGLKLQIAFQSVKPTFPDTVNAYEAKAKWDEFISDVKTKYTIELVENEAICKDKDNEYKTIKLKDLVDKDANITQMLQGRQQIGTGGKQVDVTKVDGVPFDVPKELDSEGRSKLIKEHLISKGLNITSAEYSKQFAELNNKIKNAK